MRYSHRHGSLVERHDVPLPSHPEIRPFPRGPRRTACAAVIVFAGYLLLLPHHALCSSAAMKGPAGQAHRPISDREPQTSSVRLTFLGAIEMFQKWISPIEGPRCGHSPSCSAFGHQAVREQGPVRGVMMTADRLMRCTIFKEPGPENPILPDGRIFDPPSRNLLNE